MQALIQLIIQTFMTPREIAEGIIAERYNSQTLWAGVGLVIILTGAIQYGTIPLAPEAPTPDDPAVAALFEEFMYLFSTPFLATAVAGLIIVVSVIAVHLAGRMLGGTGHFLDSLAVLGWLNFVQALFAIIQFALLAISSNLVGVANLIGMAAAIGLFYATLHFVDVIHGFGSLWAAFGTLVISFLGVLIGVGILFAMISTTPVQTGAI